MTRKAYSTSTKASDDRLVPRLAAEGPLAYTPELPPASDSLFQYGWVLPQGSMEWKSSRVDADQWFSC